MHIAWGVVVLIASWVLLVRLRQSAPDHAMFSLFRVLFPSFRFFDDIAEQPALYVRSADEGGAMGPWLLALDPPARRVHHVVWNPTGNLHLARCALLERLISDLAERGPTSVEDAEPLTSYRMVALLARDEVHTRAPHARRMQFKLREGDEDVLLSRDIDLRTDAP